MQSGALNLWKVSSSAGGQIAIVAGVLVESANGGWALDTGVGVAADGYLEDNDGPAADDAALSGGAVWRTGHRIIGTT